MSFLNGKTLIAAAAAIAALTLAACEQPVDKTADNSDAANSAANAANNASADARASPAAAEQPRNGKYVCLLYNGGAGQFEWYLTISDGAYRQTEPDLAGGTYSYDAGGHALTFTSGPYSHDNWIGLFSVEREGKTHQIVLRDRANQAKGPRVGEYSNVYCSNSTDSTY